jgi:glycosyltransferase involved in cell wall biosynthesis
MSLLPLTILQTCFSRSWGGLEMQALELSIGLRNLGHHVTFAAPPGSRLAAEATDRQLPLLLLDVTGYVHPLLVWRLRQFLRTSSTEIVHCQHSRDLATVVPAIDASGLSIHLLLSKRMGSYIRKKDLFHRYTHRRIDRILAISEAIHRNVLETLPVTPDRVLTLHDAVDTALYAPNTVDRWYVRRDAGLADDAIVVGFVGRFSPGKGLEDLLHAAHMLRDRYPSVRYLIAGEASHGEKGYAASIRALASTLHLDGTVVFAGHRTDIPAMMAAFDILAFPSHAEAFGVVLIEAMAMRRPVVSTNCDGVLDIVVDGVTGIMFPPRDPRALADALETLICNPVKRQQMGEAGRERVLRLFDRAGQLQKLEEVYRSLVRGSGDEAVRG